MRKMKNAVVTFLMAYMVYANCTVSYAAEGEQEYYLLYMYDQENGASVEIGINQVITNQAYEDINMDNLILFPIEGGVYHPFQMEQLEEEELTREIREYLLYAGYARIDDEAIAEDYELDAQEHARVNGLGGWKEPADAQEHEQTYSEAQEDENAGQTDGHTDSDTENDNDTENDDIENDDIEKVSDDGAGKGANNFVGNLLHKIKVGIWGLPLYAKIIIGILFITAIHTIRKVRKKKREEEEALRRKNRYGNIY